jgi:hypothetical protein
MKLLAVQFTGALLMLAIRKLLTQSFVPVQNWS